VINNQNRSEVEAGVCHLFLDPEWSRSQDFVRKPKQEAEFNLRFIINVKKCFVGFTTSQQESNRNLCSTFLPKQEQDPEQESNFLE